MSNAKRSEEPQDRLTRICDAMTKAMEAHPEYRDGDRCAIFMDTDTHGGLVLFGYEDDSDAIAAIFIHLAAVFEANGSRLEVVDLPARGEG